VLLLLTTAVCRPLLREIKLVQSWNQCKNFLFCGNIVSMPNEHSVILY